MIDLYDLDDEDIIEDVTAVGRPPQEPHKIDQLRIARNTHQVFVSQLSEILECENNTASVLREVRSLKELQRRALQHLLE
jgi:hypothetical protein